MAAWFLKHTNNTLSFLTQKSDTGMDPHHLDQKSHHGQDKFVERAAFTKICMLVLCLVLFLAMLIYRCYVRKDLPIGQFTGHLNPNSNNRNLAMTKNKALSNSFNAASLFTTKTGKGNFLDLKCFACSIHAVNFQKDCQECQTKLNSKRQTIEFMDEESANSCLMHKNCLDKDGGGSMKMKHNLVLHPKETKINEVKPDDIKLTERDGKKNRKSKKPKIKAFDQKASKLTSKRKEMSKNYPKICSISGTETCQTIDPIRKLAHCHIKFLEAQKTTT